MPEAPQVLPPRSVRPHSHEELLGARRRRPGLLVAVEVPGHVVHRRRLLKVGAPPLGRAGPLFIEARVREAKVQSGRRSRARGRMIAPGTTGWHQPAPEPPRNPPMSPRCQPQCFSAILASGRESAGINGAEARRPGRALTRVCLAPDDTLAPAASGNRRHIAARRLLPTTPRAISRRSRPARGPRRARRRAGRRDGGGGRSLSRMRPASLARSERPPGRGPRPSPAPAPRGSRGPRSCRTPYASETRTADAGRPARAASRRRSHSSSSGNGVRSNHSSGPSANASVPPLPAAGPEGAGRAKPSSDSIAARASARARRLMSDARSGPCRVTR